MPYPLTAVLAALAGSGKGEDPALMKLEVETLAWVFLIFGILVLILRKFAWKPLLHAVEEREKKIADSLARAEEVRRASEEIARRQEAALAEAHAQAKAVLDEARATSERYRQQELAKAKADADAFLERAKKEISLEENRARDALRREVVDLTLQAAARVLERSISGEDERRFATQVVSELQSRRVGAGA